jgi:Domain of unknown function (DUF397)
MIMRRCAEMTTVDISRAVWRKSSRSGGNGNCVEVAVNLAGAVAVRDSKDPLGPVLVLMPAAWRALITGVADGQFDLA